MSRSVRAATAMLALLLCHSAEAAVVASSSYNYFTVNGRSPAAIFQSLLNRGPKTSAGKSIASAATTAVQDGSLKQSNGSCRVANYTIKLRFVTTRPQIANEEVLPPADLRLWRQFYDFIKQHEDEHRQVWLNCASALDRKIAQIRASSCDQAASKADRMWKEMLASCNRLQRSYDSNQSAELERQPFMQRARNGATTGN